MPEQLPVPNRFLEGRVLPVATRAEDLLHLEAVGRMGRRVGVSRVLLHHGHLRRVRRAERTIETRVVGVGGVRAARPMGRVELRRD